MLLNPLDATWAEFVGVNTPDGLRRRPIFSQFDEVGAHPHGTPGYETPAGAGARRLAELQRVLASFDLVGLVERFDETLLLLADSRGARAVKVRVL